MIVCTRVYTYLCVCILYTCRCVCMFICMHMCTCTCIHVYVCTRVCACMDPYTQSAFSSCVSLQEQWRNKFPWPLRFPTYLAQQIRGARAQLWQPASLIPRAQSCLRQGTPQVPQQGIEWLSTLVENPEPKWVKTSDFCSSIRLHSAFSPSSPPSLSHSLFLPPDEKYAPA